MDYGRQTYSGRRAFLSVLLAFTGRDCGSTAVAQTSSQHTDDRQLMLFLSRQIDGLCYGGALSRFFPSVRAFLDPFSGIADFSLYVRRIPIQLSDGSRRRRYASRLLRCSAYRRINRRVRCSHKSQLQRLAVTSLPPLRHRHNRRRCHRRHQRMYDIR